MAEVAEKMKTKKGEKAPKKAMQKAPLIAMEGDKKTKKTEARITGPKKSILHDPKKEKKVGKENIIDDYKKRAEVAEAALEELKKNIGTTIEKYQRRAEKAETALEEFKKYNKKAEAAAASALDEFKHEIGAILNAGDDELKKQCRDKKIRIFGGAAMKHKYACAVLKGLIEK